MRNHPDRFLFHLALAAFVLTVGIGWQASRVNAWQQPQPDTQAVQIGRLVFYVPAGWLSWTYDQDQTERQNEQALIALVRRIDPALVADATEIIEANVPDMIAAAFAPDDPGDDLVYISLMSFGYQASLPGLKLTARATPDQVILALGFEKAEQLNGLDAGFFLEEADDGVTFTGGYALPDLDRIIVLAGGASVSGWRQYGETIQEAVRSFEIGDETAQTGQQQPQPSDTSLLAPTAVPATGQLLPGQVNAAQLPVLTPANPLYLYPYEFPVQGIITGAVDLTQQPIDPLLEKIEGTQIVPPVVGYVSAAPSFAFIAQPNPGATVGVVFAGNNYVDTVLLVHCPNGEWHFADDVKWANPDPAIAANLAQQGVYEVWIGSKMPGQLITGTLYVLVQ